MIWGCEGLMAVVKGFEGCLNCFEGGVIRVLKGVEWVGRWSCFTSVGRVSRDSGGSGSVRRTPQLTRFRDVQHAILMATV